MNTKILLSTSIFLLASCSSVPTPTPAPLEGRGSPKVQVLQLNEGARKALGANSKNELIIRVGEDGTVTFFGAEGQGFFVQAIEEPKATEKGVVNKVTVTTVKNSPACNYADVAGVRYWYPRPPCPIQ